MYKIPELKKYIEKSILCISSDNERGFKEGEFYYLESVHDNSNLTSIDSDIIDIKLMDSWDYDDIEEVTITVYLTKIENGRSGFGGGIYAEYHCLIRAHDDDGFSKHFELRTESDIRKDKIKSILDE